MMNVQEELQRGKALHQSGRLAEAQQVYRGILAMDAKHAEAMHLLGMAIIKTENQGTEEAIALMRESIRVRPGIPGFHINLGTALAGMGRHDEAIAEFVAALNLHESAEAWEKLSVALQRVGRMREAMAALERGPQTAAMGSNRVGIMNYLGDMTPGEVFAEHRRWGERYGTAMKDQARHGNDRSADRVLKVGYVSADFRMSSVAFFILPLLMGHDRSRVRVTCYSAWPTEDNITTQIRGAVDEWRSIYGVSDERAAETIRADGIDILVDLGGHTANNRLTLFGRKAAPVQVTYLAYPNTTGLTAMDWKLTDGVADPAEAEEFYTERLMRLPRTAWCFSALSGSPEIGERHGDEVRFGCFGALAKINGEMLKVWAKILSEVTGSKLVVKNPSTGSVAVNASLRRQWAEAGGVADRLEILPPNVSLADHVAAYRDIDVALDTFPYHGTTTTCEALWMGVPVASLAGKVHVSRVGVSLLNSVGLSELVAETDEQYIAIARRLAEDRPLRAEMRRTLRQRMEKSPLMDGRGMAAAIEEAYRRMWLEWIKQ